MDRKSAPDQWSIYSGKTVHGSAALRGLPPPIRAPCPSSWWEVVFYLPVFRFIFFPQGFCLFFFFPVREKKIIALYNSSYVFRFSVWKWAPGEWKGIFFLYWCSIFPYVVFLLFYYPPLHWEWMMYCFWQDTKMTVVFKKLGECQGQ